MRQSVLSIFYNKLISTIYINWENLSVNLLFYKSPYPHAEVVPDFVHKVLLKAIHAMMRIIGICEAVHYTISKVIHFVSSFREVWWTNENIKEASSWIRILREDVIRIVSLLRIGISAKK